MNKRLLLLISALFVFIVSKSQTDVSGNIATNTTWTKAGSPYVLTGDVGVPSAYTLTIEAGVTVQRSGDYEILINGNIQFNGSSADSIIFQSASNLDSTNSFFIEFQKSSLDASDISYVSFQKDGVRGNNIRIGNEQTTPDNSGILHVAHSNLNNGYSVVKAYNSTTSLYIDSCVITAGHIAGYYFSSNNYPNTISITNTQLYNSIVEAAQKISNCYMNGAVIEINLPMAITNCTAVNSYLGEYITQSGGGSGGEGPVAISNSGFTNTLIEGYNGVYNITNSNFAITTNNTFFDAFGDTDKYVLEIGTLSLQECKITNNSGSNLGGVHVTGAVFFNPPSRNYIVRNEFDGFNAAVTVLNFDSIRVDSNKFLMPGSYDIINYSPKDFSALYDYFQLKQGQTIDDLIYDQNDDLKYGLVTYRPYLTDTASILPLTLISFYGKPNGHTVQLNWETSKQINTSNFIIERKTNYAFTAIGNAAASADKTGIVNYNFTDQAPSEGINYYRLKTVDFDGKYVYSFIIPIHFSSLINSLSLYPNPASNYIIVEHGTLNTNTQLQLVDITGRKVKTVMVEKESSQTKFDLRGIAKGVYKIIWQTGNDTESQNLLVQ